MSVSWQDVARKDLEDSIRSKLLWGITVAFVVLLGFFVVVGYFANPDEVTTIDALSLLGQFSLFFVPVLALIVGYMSIVGERRSGSLRVLMSYPFSRGDVVAGKVVGRSAVIVVATFAGFFVVAGLAATLVGSFPVAELAGFFALTALLAVTFTVLAVGVSAATSTRGTAMAWVVGIFFVLLVLWQALAVGVYYLVEGARPGLVVEPWYLFLLQANPIEAYRMALMQVLDTFVWPMVQLGLEDVPPDAALEDRTIAARVDGEVPFYLRPWFAVVTFLAWAAVPVLIGYRRFSSTDLE